MTQEEVKQLLHYDPETGVFTWLVDRPNGIKAGDRAGTVTSQGYRNLSLNGWRYRSCRIAWLYMTGELPPPGKTIDHRNRLRSDDSWENLRPATRAEQSANRVTKPGATRPYPGVSQRPSGRWQAQFRMKHLGMFDTAEEASRAYEQARKAAHGSFYYGESK